MRKIPGFPNYFVNKHGKVFTRKNGKTKRLAAATKKDGYKSVVLYKDGKPHHKYVHRLVAKVYAGDAGETVNHKKGDKGDNAIENLTPMSQKDNTQHAYDTGLNKGPRGELNGKAKITKKQAKTIKKSKQTGVELAKKYKVSEAEISRIRGPHADRWAEGREYPKTPETIATMMPN